MQDLIDRAGDRSGPPSDEERNELKAALDALARPRLSGTPGAAECEAELRNRFEALGYEVRELPFSFSTWPGRFGLPAVGALYLVIVWAGTLAVLTGRGAVGLAVLLAFPLVLAAVTGLNRRVIARLPFGRVSTSNWLVHRPGARPEHLVVAHRDSKSQLLSLWLRMAAITAAPVVWIALLGIALLALIAPGLEWTPPLLGLAGLATLAGVGVAFAWAGND
jgi:hypothetical protein